MSFQYLEVENNQHKRKKLHKHVKRKIKFRCFTDYHNDIVKIALKCAIDNNAIVCKYALKNYFDSNHSYIIFECYKDDWMKVLYAFINQCGDMISHVRSNL